MASYKKPCVHCGKLIDSNSCYCVFCSSRSPFGDQCPTCLHPIQKGQPLCPDCGRPLYVPCPHCGKQTFVQDTCEACGGTLLVKCDNRRCNELQFFQNDKCTACGKKIKIKFNK